MIPAFRFSGHETFPCRYAWLPKAFLALNEDPAGLANEEEAMVSLGVGKNMVRAIRFWVQVTGVAHPGEKGSYHITEFGRELLSPQGHDPFLEDIRTLWLLHWKLSTRVEDPLFAWDYLLNRWQRPEISRTEVLSAFQREAERLDRNLSSVTLQQHFDTFLHTYVPTRGRKGDIQEDNLDCPLVELQLIEKIGERAHANGRMEDLYAFRRERKQEITADLFLFCLQDFWNTRRRNEKTLTFRDVAVAHGSPGQILKLPELDLRERLESINRDSGGYFSYEESASVQRLTRQEFSGKDFLSGIFACRGRDA